ncbi:ATP-binding cassette domain-containing protein [Desulfovibrio aerotolerans]|uniref:ATP-binding cassette domain-containing protein n=1 Tax=Solidesulfovibrio aerotolerans TaxID=295255 RepID=A0A7C9N266_9BACT|nr:ATP-binding cassette domain-containing protein [Solidesulfovibrio aerotolerans]MYL84537.1 ATP-binding cassette domain-containing protein [Solidesulfovibrio aerotolerans]
MEITDEQPVLSVAAAHKTYGTFTAVDSVSFAVRRGECFGLLGPNGAGKTTTIRMIYGFSPATGGTIQVFGQDIRTGFRRIRARLGVCQQGNTLDPDLSVLENLLVFASYFGIKRREAEVRAAELLAFFALEAKKRFQYDELSGGMARRLMLARAIINRPDLLILDEPTTGLDPQSRNTLWDRLLDLKRQGMTILLTTHAMEEAERFCDRLCIIDHGRVAAEGVPAALVAARAGCYALEVESPEEAMAEHLHEAGIRFDRSGRRLIVYGDDKAALIALRERFCAEAGFIRAATLEDVFLRLTGRELRE